MVNKGVWRLECFGGFRATNTGIGKSDPKVIERFRTQKTASLLALLALKGPQNRESLCALLWPDAESDAARNSLSVALSVLRRELGEEFLLADRQRIALAPGAIFTDVSEFDIKFQQKDFPRAVELFRGPLLLCFRPSRCGVFPGRQSKTLDSYLNP